MSILYTIATIFLVLWIFGLVMHTAFAAIGGLIHLALVIAIILFVVGLVRGRSTV